MHTRLRQFKICIICTIIHQHVLPIQLSQKNPIFNDAWISIEDLSNAIGDKCFIYKCVIQGGTNLKKHGKLNPCCI